MIQSLFLKYAHIDAKCIGFEQRNWDDCFDKGHEPAKNPNTWNDKEASKLTYFFPRSRLNQSGIE